MLPFVKQQQQMRWAPAGAHLLPQVRTHVLNDAWRATLSRWYPSTPLTPKSKAASPPVCPGLPDPLGRINLTVHRLKPG